jgi:uncharacterized protein
MTSRLEDIGRALRRWPDRASWHQVMLELCWALPLILVSAYAGGLIQVGGGPDLAEAAGLALTLLFAPALGEELLFRGALIPRDRPTGAWIVLSTTAFVLWHPLQALTIGPPWAGAFLDPWFLAAVAVLGVALGRIYAATRSLWPCVLVHWIVVFTWKAGLGGPF